MADNKQDGITIFDTLFTNNRICMMKIVLPFLPSAFQKNIAIYIKYQELQYTLQYFTRHPHDFFTGVNPDSHSPDPDTMWDNLLPYCSPTEKQTLQQMRNMMQTFRNMKDMMEMLETMKELFPEGFGSGDGMPFPEGLGSANSMPFPEGLNTMFPGAPSPELLNQLFTLLNMNSKKGE